MVTMPCLEFVSPDLTHDQKQLIATGLTDAFVDITGFEREIFGIHFITYGAGGAAQGGVMWDGSTGRPMVHLLFYSPRFDREIKQALVIKFTNVVKDVIGDPAWKPVIHLNEHPYDNIGVDGEILSDRHEELRERKFYYDL
jgi:phenylpyruvate tautomerase PptA (4-oxalocrotonate tautomerase family)